MASCFSVVWLSSNNNLSISDTYVIILTEPPTPGTPAPAPGPPCAVDVDIGCKLTNGQDCTAIQPRTENCIETLIYDIVICNVGGVIMTVTTVDFTLNGQASNLLGNLSVNPIPVGQCTTINPQVDIDVCSGGRFEAGIVVRANPPNGNMCEDDDVYVLVSFKRPAANDALTLFPLLLPDCSTPSPTTTTPSSTTPSSTYSSTSLYHGCGHQLYPY